MHTGVPARAVQHEHDLLVRAGPDLARKLGQFDFEEGDTDRRGQMEDRPPRSGMDEADEVTPFEAVAHSGNRTLSDRRPDAAQQRFQADAMFIGRPQLDLGVGKGAGHRPQQGTQVFF